jgi:hypothetical protein
MVVELVAVRLAIEVVTAEQVEATLVLEQMV